MPVLACFLLLALELRAAHAIVWVFQNNMAGGFEKGPKAAGYSAEH